MDGNHKEGTFNFDIQFSSLLTIIILQSETKMLKVIQRVCNPLLVKNIHFAIISKKNPKPNLK